MTSNFQSWEKDPFFFAAEQVQDSADRLDSAYRTWMHAKSVLLDAQDNSAFDFCRRELTTALGIATWQLEEFEKVVSQLSSDTQQQRVDDDTPQRHKQFIDAISNQLSSIKNALLSSKDERDLNVLPSVHVAQEESDQLARFLCGSQLNTGKNANMLRSCASTGKLYEEMPTSCQSATSVSISDLDLFGRLDKCASSPDTCISVDANKPCVLKDHVMNRPEIHWATVNRMDAVCINVDRSNEGLTCPTSDLSIRDCYNSAGTCIERPNGHHQSTSFGGYLNVCSERANGHHRTGSVDTGSTCSKDSASSSEYKASPNQVTKNGSSNFWSSVWKAGFTFPGGGYSANALKRWKDGEVDAIDPCKFLHGDIEQDCSIFLCQDGSWSEMQTTQSVWRGVYSRQLIQAISAILTVVGLVGLFLY